MAYASWKNIRAQIALHPTHTDEAIAGALNCPPSLVARVRASRALPGRPPKAEGTHLDVVLPPELDRWLRAYAAQNGMTLTETVRALLESARLAS